MRDLPPHQSTTDPNDLPRSTSPTITDPRDASVAEPLPASRLGMERGYSLSPMYSLILEYNQERGDNLSTAAKVSWILQRPSLKQQDIELKGDHDSHVAVRLVDSELQPLLRVVTELQTFLDRMAQLIQERTSVFRIDPHEMMTSALQGCSSRSQLEVAHKILLKQLLIAQQTVSKYEAQYRQMEILLSPISTVPELHEDFDNIESIDNRMRFMDNMPHHQSQILPAAQEALRNRLSWDVICPTLPLPSSSSQPVSLELPQSQNVQGKKKVDWDDPAPWEGTSTSLEQGRDLDEGLEPSFGFQTPFKKGTCFFDTSTDGISTTYFSTPGPVSTLDVTIGLATLSRTALGENVREYTASQAGNFPSAAQRTSNLAQTTTVAPANNSIKNDGPFASTFQSPPNSCRTGRSPAGVLRTLQDYKPKS